MVRGVPLEPRIREQVLGPVDKLLASEHSNDEKRRDLEVVARNARTLLKHVDDLLDVSKLEAGKMTADYAEADLAQLVRLTARKHLPGVGLGLSLVKEMAGALGGRVEVSSNVGTGSTFTLVLPPAANGAPGARRAGQAR